MSEACQYSTLVSDYRVMDALEPWIEYLFWAILFVGASLGMGRIIVTDLQTGKLSNGFMTSAERRIRPFAYWWSIVHRTMLLVAFMFVAAFALMRFFQEILG